MPQIVAQFPQLGQIVLGHLGTRLEELPQPSILLPFPVQVQGQTVPLPPQPQQGDSRQQKQERQSGQDGSHACDHALL